MRSDWYGRPDGSSERWDGTAVVPTGLGWSIIRPGFGTVGDTWADEYEAQDWADQVFPLPPTTEEDTWLSPAN